MRPRLLISLVGVALVLTGDSANALRQNVVIRPRLSANETFRLEIAHTIESTGPTPTSTTGRTPVDVRVVSATKDGLTLDWRPADAIVEGPDGASDLGRMLAARAIGGLTLQLLLDADGEFLRLGNEGEILPKLRSSADRALQDARKGVSADQARKIEAVLRPVLSPQNLLARVSRDAQIYLLVHGMELTPGETVEIKLEQPSPFGGGMIPKVFRAHLESVTPEQAVVTSKTTYDAAALAKMGTALVDQAGTFSAEERAAFRLEMSEDGKYVFDRKLGLLREVTVNRLTGSGSVRRLERWVIRLVTDPKR